MAAFCDVRALKKTWNLCYRFTDYESTETHLNEHLPKQKHFVLVKESNANLPSAVRVRTIAQKLPGFCTNVIHFIFLRHGASEHSQWNGFLSNAHRWRVVAKNGSVLHEAQFRQRSIIQRNIQGLRILLGRSQRQGYRVFYRRHQKPQSKEYLTKIW